jgi:hypothetical protein
MILAVDPGLSGAFAYYDGTALAVRDMPTYTAKAGARQTDRRFIDEAGVLRLLSSTRLAADILVMEQVGGIPGQSAPAAFTFGYGVGFVLGVARQIGYRIERVSPATWKSALRVPADKRAARARASELLPAYSDLWPLQKHDGRAESAMLALYGFQVFGRAT